MQRFNIDQNKLSKVIQMVQARRASLDSSEIEDFIDTDWPNASEHQQWLNEAPAAEIASWIEAGIE